MSKDSIINEVKLMLCKNQYPLLRRSAWVSVLINSLFSANVNTRGINMLSSSKFFDES